MRITICTALCVLLGAVAIGAATLEYDPGDRDQVALAAKIQQLQEQALADLADSTRDAVRTALADSVYDRVAAFGVSIVADARDPAWVALQYPLEAAQGFERAFITDRIADLVAAGGENLGSGKVRARADTAVDALKILYGLLPAER